MQNIVRHYKKLENGKLDLGGKMMFTWTVKKLPNLLLQQNSNQVSFKKNCAESFSIRIIWLYDFNRNV